MLPWFKSDTESTYDGMVDFAWPCPAPLHLAVVEVSAIIAADKLHKWPRARLAARFNRPESWVRKVISLSKREQPEKSQQKASDEPEKSQRQASKKPALSQEQAREKPGRSHDGAENEGLISQQKASVKPGASQQKASDEPEKSQRQASKKPSRARCLDLEILDAEILDSDRERDRDREYEKEETPKPPLQGADSLLADSQPDGADDSSEAPTPKMSAKKPSQPMPPELAERRDAEMWRKLWAICVGQRKRAIDVAEVWDGYRGDFPKVRVLSPKGYRKIADLLDSGYAASELAQVSAGVIRSEFHMRGHYTGIETVFRDASTVDAHLARRNDGGQNRYGGEQDANPYAGWRERKAERERRAALGLTEDDE